MNSNSYEYDISCVCILQYDKLGNLIEFKVSTWIFGFLVFKEFLRNAITSFS